MASQEALGVIGMRVAAEARGDVLTLGWVSSGHSKRRILRRRLGGALVMGPAAPTPALLVSAMSRGRAPLVSGLLNFSRRGRDTERSVVAPAV
jgi:hypothetical protein